MNPETTANELRQQFFNFFKGKGHLYVHSSSTIPHNDPTLLFSNAGMNQFKPIFQGVVDPNTDMAQLKRVVNTQKCIRAGGKHNDLDDVGRDVYHHTFFEMLGNWSFGDYFKKEACNFAWELLTRVWKIPAKRLYVTYFEGNNSAGLPPDDEARQIWLDLGLDSEHILPFGMKDNFWEMGETGPCGPCSEIHYDRVGRRNAAHLVNQDDPDVLEIWNLVFIQFNRYRLVDSYSEQLKIILLRQPSFCEENGKLRPLPAKHIDTGMGLERVLSVIQGKKSNYDTDLFQPLFKAIQRETGVRPYTGKVGADDVDRIDMAYRVLADHARVLTIALSDGGRPQNTGRGYVLRRILRRAVRYSVEVLNAKPGFFASLIDVVVDTLKDTFPEVNSNVVMVKQIINEEEQQFLLTLKRGQRLLSREITTIRKQGGDCHVLPGSVAWRLYDTYGFPLDLTQLIAEENDLKVDVPGYEKAKESAQLRSQAGTGVSGTAVDLDVHAIAELRKKGLDATNDMAKYDYSSDEGGNYVFPEIEASILAIRTETEFTDSVDRPGQVCGLVLDRTIFYAEAGGQQADHGFVTSITDEFAELSVIDVQCRGGYVLHIGQLEGRMSVGDKVRLTLDSQRRTGLMRSHTGTHVLNFALRKVLGESDQKGSLVAPDRLRFDFSLDVSSVFIFFLLDCAHFQHVQNVSHIKSLVIVSEESIAKGIRRIVALTGSEADRAALEAIDLLNDVKLIEAEIKQILAEKSGDEAVQQCRAQASNIATLSETVVRANISQVARNQLRDLLSGYKKTLDELDKSRKVAIANQVMEQATALSEKYSNVTDGHSENFIVHVFPAQANAKTLNGAMKLLETKCPNIAIMALSADPMEQKLLCLTQVPKSLTSRGLKANEWVNSVSATMNGKGGGKDTFAQATGSHVDAVNEVIRLAERFASAKLSS
ncbi:Alanine--tRNA ligase cytoplasmic [Fasciola gigantica]|uniref:Alanine--tRNA ligase n=1 Tax=Fasciola gigantica TaxID=46835 RepID=A0A504YAB9_FASGI|nr:Alanine--tRNA ligase cytoplasmic [Fasciola gigantica]